MYIINVSAESSGGIRLTNTTRDRKDAVGIVKSLWRRHRVFTQCWRAGQVNVFSRQFFCFRFSRSLKAIKRRWPRFGLSFAVVNINKMIFVVKPSYRWWAPSEALARDNLALSSILFNLLRWNLSKFSLVKIFVLPIIWNRKKIGVTKAVSSLFVFSSFISNLVLLIFCIHRY